MVLKTDPTDRPHPLSSFLEVLARLVVAARSLLAHLVAAGVLRIEVVADGANRNAAAYSYHSSSILGITCHEKEGLRE